VLGLSRRLPLTAICLVLLAVPVTLILLVNGCGPSTNTSPNRDPHSPFRECATEVGITWRMNYLPDEQGENFQINLYDHGAGLAIGDYDGDGRDDIYFCNQLGKNALYRNKGDGTFEDVTEKAGVAAGDRVCVAAVFVDYDNSGRQSLFVTSTRGGNIMFQNNGDGTFSDVTEKLGLTHVGHAQTPIFFDYDNDGYLDLFIPHTGEWTIDEQGAGRHQKGKDIMDMLGSKIEENLLYHNVPVDPKDPSKGRKFVKVPDAGGLKGHGWTGGAVAFDYDGDGYTDLFITAMFNRCQLYRNNRDGTFTDVTHKLLGKTPAGGVSCNVFDYNNDGRLDILVMDMHSDMWMGLDVPHASEEKATKFANKKFPFFSGPAKVSDEELKQHAAEAGVSLDEVFFGNGCFRQEKDGKFTEVSDAAGLETFWPWGAAIGDYTNSGREDIFISAGMGNPFWYWPNAYMKNNGDGTFTDQAKDMGIEPTPRGPNMDKPWKMRQKIARSSRSAATGDFDGDGRLEIVVNNFNDQPYYFKNQAPAKNWIGFRLKGLKHEGKKCNRDAIGAIVRLYRGDTVMTRPVLPAVGYLAQSSRTLHFGLGDSKDFDCIEISWPGHAQPQVLKNLDVNKVHPIEEP